MAQTVHGKGRQRIEVRLAPAKKRALKSVLAKQGRTIQRWFEDKVDELIDKRQ